MNRTIKAALLTSAFLTFGLLPAAGRADTTVTNTTVSQVNLPHTQKVDFSAFDLNHDGVLSTAEVGEKLFYLFDQDGNHVIDNLEYKYHSVLTIIPMKQTTLSYHIDEAGNVDDKSVTQSDFEQRSGLAVVLRENSKVRSLFRREAVSGRSHLGRHLGPPDLVAHVAVVLHLPTPHARADRGCRQEHERENDSVGS